jgi:hypothetical protein
VTFAGGDQIGVLPSVSPFGDVPGVPDSIQPGESPLQSATDQLLFNLTPGVKLPAALAGLNLGKGPLRPPGEPGGYGGPPGTHVPDPGEMLNVLGNQFPQARVLRGLFDVANHGKVVAHYPLGAPRKANKTEGGAVQGTGDPVLGPLARYLGLPYVRGVAENKYEKRDAKKAARDLSKSGPG